MIKKSKITAAVCSLLSLGLVFGLGSAINTSAMNGGVNCSGDCDSFEDVYANAQDGDTTKLLKGFGSSAEPFNYVSFGASQAAGMGLHGFVEEHFYDEPEKLYPTKNALERDGYYSSGYIKYSEQSYPSLIKNELAKSYDIVNLHQCAINSMRAYDLAYMLDSSFPKDKYIDWRLGDETNGWIHDINRARDESVTFLNGDVVNFKKDETNIREEFRSYVASADLISYDLGSNDFLIYVGNMITERLKDPQKFQYSNDLHPLIGEDADKFLVLKGMVEDFILPTLGDTLDPTILNLLDFLADTLAYACVGFIKGFDTAMKVIYDLNPDVEVVVLGIQNMAQDVKITLEGKTINLGEYLGYVIKAANIYTSYLSPFSDRYYYTEMGGNGRATLFYDEIKAWDGNPSSISPLIKEAFNVYEQEFLVKTEIRKFITAKAETIIEVYNSVAPDKDKVTTPEAAAPVLAALQERIAEYVYYYIMDATNIAFQDMMVDPLNVDEDALNFMFELAQAPEALQAIVMNLVQGNDDSDVYAAVHAQIVGLLKDPKVHSTVAMVMLTSYGNSVFAHPNEEGHKEMAKVVMDAYNTKKIVKNDLGADINARVLSTIDRAKAYANAVAAMILEKAEDASVEVAIELMEAVDYAKAEVIIAKEKVLEAKEKLALTMVEVKAKATVAIEEMKAEVNAALAEAVLTLAEQERFASELLSVALEKAVSEVECAVNEAEKVLAEKIAEIDALIPQEVKDFVNFVLDHTQFDEEATEIIVEFVAETKEDVEDIVEIVKEAVEETVEFGSELAEETKEELGEIIVQGVEEAKPVIEEANDEIAEIVEEKGSEVIAGESEIAKEIVSEANDAKEDIKAEAISSVETVGEAAEEAAEDAAEEIEEIIEEFIPQLKDMWSSFFNFF